MNRRTFLQAGLGAGVVTATSKNEVLAQTPEVYELQVQSEWVTDGKTDSGLDTFITRITAHNDVEEATQRFDKLFEGVQAGTIYNEDTRNETFGDESFFVQYDNLGGLFLIYEGTIRIRNLIYEFRWEATHYGGARGGHKIFESVIEQAEIREAYTEDELLALLPAEGELTEYGLVKKERKACLE